MARTLWVTRTEPGASQTAEALRAMGFEVVTDPLLTVRPVAGVRLDLRGVGAVAFTSANAVRAFSELTGARPAVAFAVGEATAAAARAAGFEAVVSAGADAAALAKMISAHRREIEGAVLYPAPTEPSQDLAAALRSAGFDVRQVAVYQTVPRSPSPDLLRRLPTLDAVVLHSARAAAELARTLEEHRAPRLAAFCLSAQVAAPLAGAGLALVRTSAAPTEAALLSMIGEAWR